MLSQERNLKFFDAREFDQTMDRNLLCHSFPLECAALRDSIAACGLAQPLLLCQNILVSGHRRYHALKNLANFDKIPVLELPKMTLEESFQLALAENTANRTLNLMERARALVCLQKLDIPETEIIQTWLPRLGAKPSQALFAQYTQLLQLSKEWQHWVAQENPNLKTALLLVDLDPDTQAQIFSLQTQFRFGINRLDEILQNLNLIAKRNDSTITRILQDIPLQNAEAIRTQIHRLAYPVISDMEDQFLQAAKKLKLPSSISLRPPQHFEGDRLDVQFQFGSPEELKKAAQRLLESADQDDLHDMLDLL